MQTILNKIKRYSIAVCDVDGKKATSAHVQKDGKWVDFEELQHLLIIHNEIKELQDSGESGNAVYIGGKKQSQGIEVRLCFKTTEALGTTIFPGDTFILNQSKGFIIYKDDTINLDYDSMNELRKNSNEALPDDLEV